MTALYLGVDGGGTKTEFVCMDADGKLVARAQTGGTYHNQIGVDGVVARLLDGVTEIRAQLGAGAPEFAYAFFGLPAYGEDSVVDPRLDRAVGAMLGHDRYACGNDMVCGWAGSLACEDGINLVAGTGSIAYGERGGRTARAGGWGEVFGDEGSAYWIAIQGLAAFSRMSDGRMPMGPLHTCLIEALSLRDDIDLCARILGERGMARDEIAGLARVIASAAHAGDAAATAILDAAAGELFALAEALRTALEFGPSETVQLSWSGGVVTGEPLVRDALADRLRAAGRYSLVDPRHTPAHGAALYAAHLARMAGHS